MRTIKLAKDLKKGDLWAPTGGKHFKVTFLKKLHGAYKGWLRVQYAQPEVPGGIGEQTIKLNEPVTAEPRSEKWR